MLGVVNESAINSFEDAWQVVEDYEHRWLIEEYHKVIKSACSIESHALRAADRLEPLIGMISVLGTRLFQLKTDRAQSTQCEISHSCSHQLVKVLKACSPEANPYGLDGVRVFPRACQARWVSRTQARRRARLGNDLAWLSKDAFAP